MAATTTATTGQIHDLGYKRYVGSRSAVGTRWTVIMRHQIATGWKGWWRYKAWLITAILVTATIALLMYQLSDQRFSRIGGVGGVITRFVDGLLPDSVAWYRKIAFFVGLTIGASVVAGDVQSGALTFYFARSVRPRDYVLGKLAGFGVLIALIMIAGPLVLAGVRLGLSSDLDQLIALLPVLYKVLAVGALATLVYTALPLGFSALIPNRRHAMALWGAYYIVVGAMSLSLGRLVAPALGAIDPADALYAVSLHLFDLHAGRRSADPPTSVALFSIAAHVAVAIGLLVWRVRKAQQTGVGGSS
jgi:ABC-type transport system involved in multi-copper enzyme maturation permease subunit